MSRTIGKLISPTVSANCGHRADADHLVHGGRQRDVCPGHLRRSSGSTPRRPRRSPRVSMSPALVRSRRDPPVLDVDARAPRRSARWSARPCSIARSRMIVPARTDSTTPTLGVQNAPTITARVEERHLLLDLRRGDELAVDAPGLGRRDPAGQLLHPLRAAGHLEAAGLGEDAELVVLASGCPE